MAKLLGTVLSLLVVGTLTLSLGGGAGAHRDPAPRADPYWCC